MDLVKTQNFGTRSSFTGQDNKKRLALHIDLASNWQSKMAVKFSFCLIKVNPPYWMAKMFYTLYCYFVIDYYKSLKRGYSP